MWVGIFLAEGSESGEFHVTSLVSECLRFPLCLSEVSVIHQCAMELLRLLAQEVRHEVGVSEQLSSLSALVLESGKVTTGKNTPGLIQTV